MICYKKLYIAEFIVREFIDCEYVQGSCALLFAKVVTASHDSTIRLWDLAAGKTKAVLTNHKKSVRALALHPNE